MELEISTAYGPTHVAWEGLDVLLYATRAISKREKRYILTSEKTDSQLFSGD